MSQKVRLADGTELDMLNPVSIRDYVRKTLALNVSPTASELSRLTMMRELAEELEAKQPKPDEQPASLDDLAAARERLRQARLAERGGK